MKYTFTTEVQQSGPWSIIRLPREISQQLPSRGLVVAQGTVDGKPTVLPLEPDGAGGHWFQISKDTGTTTSVSFDTVKDWPEPTVPADLQAALSENAEASAVWNDITPMARWDWIRWIRSTNNQEARAKRITVAFDKMRKGSRRPCCFNRSMCTEPTVSKNGVLLPA